MARLRPMTTASLWLLALALQLPLTPLAAVPENGIVRGGVIDPDGHSVPNVRITLTLRTDAGEPAELSVLSDARGKFRASVSSGRWEVRTKAEGYYQAPVDYKEVGIWLSAVYPEVTLGAGDRKEVRLEMIRCSFLEGRVLDHNGQPVTNRALRVVVPRHAMFTGYVEARTNARGVFRLPFDYSGDDAFALLCPGAGYAPVTPVQLESGKTLKVTYRLKPLASVDGVLLRGDGSPAAGVTVTLQGGWPFVTHDHNTAFIGEGSPVAVASPSVRTDHTGRFRFEALPGGEYTLSPPGKAFAVPLTLRDGEKRSGVFQYGFKGK